MGINSTAMRILIEKGLSIHDILEVAEALEGHIPERFKARQKVEDLECACVPCNMSKGSKLLSEWMRAGK